MNGFHLNLAYLLFVVCCSAAEDVVIVCTSSFRQQVHFSAGVYRIEFRSSNQKNLCMKTETTYATSVATFVTVDQFIACMLLLEQINANAGLIYSTVYAAIFIV